MRCTLWHHGEQHHGGQQHTAKANWGALVSPSLFKTGRFVVMWCWRWRSMSPNGFVILRWRSSIPELMFWPNFSKASCTESACRWRGFIFEWWWWLELGSAISSSRARLVLNTSQRICAIAGNAQHESVLSCLIGAFFWIALSCFPTIAFIRNKTSQKYF